MLTRDCAAIESHVRTMHLGYCHCDWFYCGRDRFHCDVLCCLSYRPKQNDEELSDHEEEFYYTELEEGDIDDQEATCTNPNGAAAVASVASAAAVNMSAAAAAVVSGASSVSPGANRPAIALMNPAQNYSASIDAGLMTSSPPTLSHMDMARPPHEGVFHSRLTWHLIKFCKHLS